MNISAFKTLIANLPVRQQSFTTKRTTWEKAEKEIEWLRKLNDNLFNDKKIITISRQDIFETTDLRELIIKTIYWGYTGGMRGNHFVNILKQVSLLENTFSKLKQKQNSTSNDFTELSKIFKNISGLGLSTYSKLLYFLQITFNDNPCLILDQRLIDVFATKAYSEYNSIKSIRYDNAEKKYLDFLQLTNEVCKNLGTEGENIEQFLFIFGNNLKPVLAAKKISNIWNGNCPESLLSGKTIRMRLNQQDFFESEETGLQICIIQDVQAVILNFRGKGKFRTTLSYADEIENGEILSPQNTDRPPFNSPTVAFNDSEEIENYITTIN